MPSHFIGGGRRDDLRIAPAAGNGYPIFDETSPLNTKATASHG